MQYDDDEDDDDHKSLMKNVLVVFASLATIMKIVVHHCHYNDEVNEIDLVDGEWVIDDHFVVVVVLV